MTPSDPREPDRFASPTGESAPSDWIESVADAEGIDSAEAAKRLVSAYWTFKEMTSLMETPEGAADVGSDETDVEPGAGGDEPVSDPLAARPAEAEIPAPIRAELEELGERIDEVADSVGGRHDALEDRLDDEIVHIEEIFEYLIERTDANESELGELREILAEGRAHREAQERLVELTRRAAGLGIGEAACGACGSTVDLGLLAVPECPSCGHAFARIDPGSRWPWGRGPTLAGPKPAPEPAPAPDPEPTAPDSTDPTGADGGFVWGEDRH